MENKNKYGMFAGWSIMGQLDVQGQELAEYTTGVGMLTSEAKFKFKKQCCSEKEFMKDKLQTICKAKVNEKGKWEVYITYENEFIVANLIYIEFKHNFCKC